MQQSIVWTWPYSLIFWLVFLWAFVPEFRIISGRGEDSAFARDAKSKALIIYGGNVAAIAAFALAIAVPAASLAHPALWGTAGIALMIAGSLLRRHCFKMLGGSFTGTVIVKPDQAVVERGAYRYVRHPSYTAGAVLFLGIGVALANWLSVLVLLVSTAIVYAYRVRVEESALVTVIGEPYRAYISRTKRFVPFVF